MVDRGVGIVEAGVQFSSEALSLKCPGGGIGRHACLKSKWTERSVRVRLPFRVRQVRFVFHELYNLLQIFFYLNIFV